MKTWRSVILVLAGAVLASCALIAEPHGEPDFVAVIESFQEGPIESNTFGTVRVMHPGAEPPQDRTVLHLTKDTKVFFHMSPGRPQPGGIEALIAGATVRVWTTGYELRSYPRQMIATRIAVINAGDAAEH